MAPTPARGRALPRHHTCCRGLPSLGAALVLAAGRAAAADAPADPGPAATSTQPVVVTARRLAVETLVDRKVYSIEADVQSTFGTVSDVLTAIPSVDVDVDGGIALRGDSNVVVLVDGKPSPLFSGPNAGENLQSIPAQDIERIEVIPNPPAQFRADGTAGVINIITRKHHEDGTAGSVQASLGSGGRSMVGGNIAHKSGALSVGLNATYRQDFKDRTTRTDLVTADPAGGLPIDQSSTIREHLVRTSPPLELTLRYEPDDRQAFSASLSRTGRAGLRTYVEDNDTTDAGGTLLGATRRLSAGHDRSVNLDGRLDYTRSLSRKGETLEMSLSRFTNTNAEHYDYTNEPLLPPAPTYYDNLGFRERTGVSEAELDYVRPLAGARTLRTGASVEQYDYAYGSAGFDVDPASGTATENPLLHDDYRYWRQIAAAYATLQATHGAWTWLGGLRAESLRAEGRQLTQALATDTRSTQLFPSLHVERASSERSTWSASASRRVTRPDAESQNPFVDREYTPALRAGNPTLAPQYTQSYELGYAYDHGGWATSLTGYLRRNRDTATDLTLDLGGGLTLQTRTNLPRDDSAGLEFTATGHLGSRLGFNLSGNAFRAEIDATALGTPGLRTTEGLNAKLKLDYRMTGRDALQATVNRTDRRLTPQGELGASTVVNFGLRHALRPTLSLVATLSDAFHGMRSERTATTPTFTAYSLRTSHSRIAWVGLVQSFGSTRKAKPAGFEYDP